MGSGEVEFCQHKNIAMQILNIPEDKEIFTAKVGLQFVGCCRLEHGIAFTYDAFDKPLAAANAARKLKKELTTSSKETVTKAPVVTKKTAPSKAKKKTVTPSKPQSRKKVSKSLISGRKLYTADETEKMPLLSFREVWVIRRYEDYVSDALNHEKKRLVAYCGTKEAAKPFGCHEEAKRVMKTLKGVVGPGFNLQRFFVRHD